MKSYHYYSFLLLSCLIHLACINSKNKENKAPQQSNPASIPYDSKTKTIHVFVALCDNVHQGIVPVPKAIGNGQDPANNLYWGCQYGIKTYFNRSNDWKLIRKEKLNGLILERLVYKHKSKNYYLIADAYNGKEIKQCTINFLKSSSGQLKETLQVDQKTIGISGNARLMAYIGHDGLMDFNLNNEFVNADQKKRDVIILACYSKRFFGPHLDKKTVNPLVWTSNLMCPEAYSLNDALNGYMNNESNEQFQQRGAAAYSKYQECSLRAAKNLLVTGW